MTLIIPIIKDKKVKDKIKEIIEGYDYPILIDKEAIEDMMNELAYFMITKK